jgi:ATP-dependent RNA circularization protein (DNA/RNA ligase family)
MKKYHKIQTVYKRDPGTKYKTLLEGEFSIPEFEYLRNNEWIFTEKVDGTNIRVMQIDGKITFGGKTDRAQIPAKLVERLYDTFLPLGDKLVDIFGGSDVCLYGEGYGAKIQKGGGNYRKDQDFVLFDVKVGEWWLQRKDVDDVAQKLAIDIVPIIGKGTLQDMVSMAREGITSTWGDFQAEGIVARPSTELVTRNGSRLITKIKTRDFKKHD